MKYEINITVTVKFIFAKKLENPIKKSAENYGMYERPPLTLHIIRNYHNRYSRESYVY